MKTEKEILLAVATPAEWWVWAENPDNTDCLRCRAMDVEKSPRTFACDFCGSFSGYFGDDSCYDPAKYKTDSEAAIASLIRAGIEKPESP